MKTTKIQYPPAIPLAGGGDRNPIPVSYRFFSFIEAPAS